MSALAAESPIINRSTLVLIVAAVAIAGAFLAFVPWRATDCANWGARGFAAAATAEHVSACLADGADPNAIGRGGLSLLHAAAANGDSAIGKMLLESDADPNARITKRGRGRDASHEGATPLHLAAANGEALAMIEALLESGADPNLFDSEGESPLHVAAAEGGGAIVARLLAAGANPNAADNDGVAPLRRAATKHPEAVEALLKAGADPNARDLFGHTPLFAAVYNGKVAAVEMLLEAGVDPNAPIRPSHRRVERERSWRLKAGFTLLHLAAHESDTTAVMELLLKAGADPGARTQDGYTPLHLAAEKSAPAVIEMLLEAGADLHAQGGTDGDTPLEVAAEHNTAAVIEMLLDAGADPNRSQYGPTPLYYAAGHNTLAVIEMLLEAGAGPNGNQYGSPLLHAADHVKLAAVETLLKAGSDPNARDESDHTPLHLAVGNRFTDDDDPTQLPAVEALLKAGADPNARNESGETPLHMMMRFIWHSSEIGVPLALLEAGADPNARDKNGDTPLHRILEVLRRLARGGGNAEKAAAILRYVGEALLKAGADPKMPNGFGERPLDYAEWTLLWGIHKEAPGPRKPRRLSGSEREQWEQDFLRAELMKAAIGEYSHLQEESRRAALDGLAGRLRAALKRVGNCEEWNTESFFSKAETEDIVACLALGANPHAVNADGFGPLHLTVRHGMPPGIAGALLEAGADPNAAERDGNTPLHETGPDSNAATVKALLDAGADPNATNGRGFTPLHRASWSSTPYVIHALLKGGARVGAMDGSRLLSQAKPENIRALLQAGVAPDATPVPWHAGRLHQAASQNNGAMIEALLYAGADPNETDENGRAPLHISAVFLAMDATAALLNAGADPNARDSNRDTPLHAAAKALENPFSRMSWASGYPGGFRTADMIGWAREHGPAAADALLDAGADNRARNRFGHTAFRYVQWKGELQETPIYQRLRPTG